jgi:nitroreductase
MYNTSTHGTTAHSAVISEVRMLTTKEAIEQRRSIRKFRPDPVPDEFITALLDAARLAPSGSNAQPWRFKVVKDKETKLKLVQAAYNQSFIADAPIVLVCCADIKGYLDGTVSGVQDLGRIGAIEGRIMEIILERTNKIKTMNIEQLEARVAVNLAIAIEHIVLRALDFGLGSCWIRLVDEQVIKNIFGWDDHISVFALLPIGYPAESPPSRKRLKLEEIIID